MDIDIVTKEDLQRALEDFRRQLLNDFKEVITSANGNQKQWLKSEDVKRMLKISPGTLQSLRISGKLNPTKLGGTYYYKLAEIELLLSSKPSL